MQLQKLTVAFKNDKRPDAVYARVNRLALGNGMLIFTTADGSEKGYNLSEVDHYLFTGM